MKYPFSTLSDIQCTKFCGEWARAEILRTLPTELHSRTGTVGLEPTTTRLTAEVTAICTTAKKITVVIEQVRTTVIV